MADDTPEKSVPLEIQQYVGRRIREANDNLKVLIERNKDRIDDIDDRTRRNEAETILVRGEMKGGFDQMRESQKRNHEEQMLLLQKISSETFEPLKEFIAMIQTPEQRAEVFGAIRQTIRRRRKGEELGDEVTRSFVRWAVPALMVTVIGGLLLLLANYVNSQRASPSVTVTATASPSGSAESSTPTVRYHQP